MTELEKLCFMVAFNYHAGQLDKGGNDYINHPIAVAQKVDTETEKCVALLHDIIEDTELTSADLLKLGIPQYIVDYVQILTREKSESYEKYIQRVGMFNVTRKVKLADLSHNMDLSRIPNPTQKDMKRLEKYKKYYNYLILKNLEINREEGEER